MTKILPIFKTEYELARALANKDRKAYQTFYDGYSGKLLAICLRYISDKMTAEDVMVESIMKIFEKIGQFNYTGSFEGWVKRIVVNEALMFLRSKKMIEVDIDEMVQLPTDVSPHEDFEAEELMKIINELPVGYKTVFNLYAIEGYSHAEIGNMLNISEGTSKSQLSRARAILQDKLKKNEQRDIENKYNEKRK